MFCTITLRFLFKKKVVFNKFKYKNLIILLRKDFFKGFVKICPIPDIATTRDFVLEKKAAILPYKTAFGDTQCNKLDFKQIRE